MNEDFLDEDGYPTDAALDHIKNWPWQKSYTELFETIKELWAYADWGWSEGWEDHPWREGEKIYCYHISTAGWSGNESIIRAMQENAMFWCMCWIQSRRGGHYIFEAKEYGSNE